MGLNWVCEDCGYKHGTEEKELIESIEVWDETKCDICGEKDYCTSPKVFGLKADFKLKVINENKRIVSFDVPFCRQQFGTITVRARTNIEALKIAKATLINSDVIDRVQVEYYKEDIKQVKGKI